MWEEMSPSTVGRGMRRGIFGFWTSNTVSFDAFWMVFLTAQPLAIYADTSEGADPGMCVWGSWPLLFLPFTSSSPSPPLSLEVGHLIQLRDLGERCKLPLRRPGRSYGLN